MAKVLQSPEWSSRSGPEGEDLTRIERWFLSQGVPQFVYGYWPGRDSMPVLFFLLLIVVAFDLAIQPWASLSPWSLLVAPAVFVFVGLAFGLLIKATIIDQARYLIRKLEELEKESKVDKNSSLSFKEQLSCLISNPVQLAMLFAGVYLFSCLILLLGRDVYWNDFTMDFAVVAVLLWSSAKLFRRDLWSEDAKLREHRRLYAVVGVAVIGFALEGSILPDATAMMDSVLGSIVPAAVPVPQAFAALLVTVSILVQSHTLIPAPSEAGEVAAHQRFNVFFPAVPLLVLVFCVETAILPYVGPFWVAAAVPLAAMVGFASLHLLLPRWPKWLTTPSWLKKIASYPSVRGFITYPGVTSLVVLYLVACPLVVGTLATSDENQPSIGAFTNSANARSVLLLTFAVNLFYVSLVVGIAVFRLQDVARWAIKEAWTDLRERISNLGRGLSFLVVFAALALLTAETWEAMRRISTKNYLLLLGSILGLAGAFHLITSVQHVTKTAAFGTWSEVRAAAMLEEESSQNDDKSPDPAIKELLDSKELHSPTLLNVAPKRPLGGLETINSVIVMMTYEIFFFFPVTIVAAIVFLTFGHITVPYRIGANWIYGDRATREEIVELINLPLIQQPWLRVGLLLTALSILYLVVELLSDPDKRSIYFESADKAVRRRLAVRLAYCEVRARRNLPLPGQATPTGAAQE
jgi:hypothetical protein